MRDRLSKKKKKNLYVVRLAERETKACLNISGLEDGFPQKVSMLRRRNTVRSSPQGCDA